MPQTSVLLILIFKIFYSQAMRGDVFSLKIYMRVLSQMRRPNVQGRQAALLVQHHHNTVKN